MCNHCPYVVHLMDGLVSTAQNFKEKGIETIAISSNSEHSHPQDGPIEMKKISFGKELCFSLFV